ncbi:hypothetical protein O0L34_g353 [Tuta absoluta]|nr:hypothetical protein O0L34_g353 [Tuta absoluta]
MDILASHHCKKDFRSFWKTTKKLQIRPGLPVAVDGVSDPKGIADLFRSHFFVKSPLGHSPCAGMVGAGDIIDEVGVKISAKDVGKAIKSISKGKSPGHDGLSIEHLQHAGPHISRVLGMFYTLCIRHSYLPQDLMRTIVVPVVKDKTGDISDKNNYRPISLATIIAKVFDSVLNTQLEKHLNLHSNQFGFRPGLSTESAILCLKHTVKYYLNHKTPVYSCFLDLSKFHLIWFPITSYGKN